MKIMFMGTPDFAKVSLEKLINSENEVVCVITMPDKPRGRGHKMVHTPVYECAQNYGIDTYTPENLKKENFENILNTYSPEIIVVVAYGKILPEYVLTYPKYGCVNVHASLLPKYRGAAPIQRSIIDGMKTTGVTTMYMEKGLDTGDMLLSDEIEIKDDDNYETIHDKLSIIGAQLICETIDGLNKGTVTRIKQDDSLSTYAHMITKETCLVNWNNDALSIHNLIRGLYPFPKAFTYYGNSLLKIGFTKVSHRKSDEASGKIIFICDDYFSVSCGNNTVIDVYKIQFEGKKMMDVCDYLKGNKLELGIILGG